MGRRMYLGTAVLIIVAGLAAACGSSSGSPGGGATAAYARPAVLASLPKVELVGPSATSAGPAPLFEWRAAAGATRYRLTVRGPNQAGWAWLGDATSVRYGGVSEGQLGPSIVPGMVWSVAGLGADGSLIAMSDLRPVSPTADAGPAPDWLTAGSGGAAATPDAADPSPDDGLDACDLLTADEIGAAIRGTWGDPELNAYGNGFGDCSWESKNGTLFSLYLSTASSYDPDGWGADGSVEDLGDASYAVNHGWDRRIGFLHGDRSVMLVIDYLRVDPEGFADLARLAESRLP